LPNGLQVNVCSLAGIVLLKLFSWNDRKERDKDITDIKIILHHYLELQDLEEYGLYTHVLDLYDPEDVNNYQSLVAARIVGNKISDMLQQAPEVKQRIASILLLRLDSHWQAINDGLNDNE
jgi:predicted nucleotidyltransferase